MDIWQGDWCLVQKAAVITDLFIIILALKIYCHRQQIIFCFTLV